MPFLPSRNTEFTQRNGLEAGCAPCPFDQARENWAMVLSKHSGQKPWETRTSASTIPSSQSPLHFTLRHTQQTVRIFPPPFFNHRNRPHGIRYVLSDHP